MARFGLSADQPEALLFTGLKGGTLRRSWVQRHFNPAVQRAGLPETVDFHGLRHVATSYMVADNEHPRTIQQRLGHADPRLTMGLYAHVPDEVDRSAADRLEAMWRASRLVGDVQSYGR